LGEAGDIRGGIWGREGELVLYRKLVEGEEEIETEHGSTEEDTHHMDTLEPLRRSIRNLSSTLGKSVATTLNSSLASRAVVGLAGVCDDSGRGAGS
jgi:hypothetical protein